MLDQNNTEHPKHSMNFNYILYVELHDNKNLYVNDK